SAATSQFDASSSCPTRLRAAPRGIWLAFQATMSARSAPPLPCSLINIPNLTRLHIVLLGQVVADLDEHGDAFRVAWFSLGLLVSVRAEFPGVVRSQHRNRDTVGAISVNLQFCHCQRDKFGFGLHWLAHDDGVSPNCFLLCEVAALRSACRGGLKGFIV